MNNAISNCALNYVSIEKRKLRKKKIIPNKDVYLEFRYKFGVPNLWTVYEFLADVDYDWEHLNVEEKQKYISPTDIFPYSEEERLITEVFFFPLLTQIRIITPINEIG